MKGDAVIRSDEAVWPGQAVKLVAGWLGEAWFGCPQAFKPISTH